MENTKEVSEKKQCDIHVVSNSSILESQLCPKCRKKGSLRGKTYLMFSRVCKNDGTIVKKPNHPDYNN
jgi:hypothetical protein